MVAALSLNHSKKALLWTAVRKMSKVRIKAGDGVLVAMRPADHARQQVFHNAVNPITV
jgi:translation initiation factor IF-1